MLCKTTSTDWQFDCGRLPSDLGEYIALCVAGGLYQAVADRLGVTRGEAKPWHRTRAAEAIQERFPNVMQAMQEVKRGDHRRLAHFAQRIESGFMFGRVVPRIIRERSADSPQELVGCNPIATL